MNNDLYSVGKIIGTYGLNGKLKVVFDILHFQDIFPHARDRHGNLLKLQYDSAWSKNVHLCYMSNYDHINKIRNFVGKELFVKKSDLDAQSKLIQEISVINCTVYDNKDRYLGVVESLMDFGGGILLKITKDDDYEFWPEIYIQNHLPEQSKIIVVSID